MIVASFSSLRKTTKGRPVFRRISSNSIFEELSEPHGVIGSYIQHQQSIHGFRFPGWEMSTTWSYDGIQLVGSDIRSFRLAGQAVRTIDNLRMPRNMSQSKLLTNRVKNRPRTIEHNYERIIVSTIAGLPYTSMRFWHGTIFSTLLQKQCSWKQADTPL